MASMNKPASGDTNWYTPITDNWTSIENNLLDKAVLTSRGDLFVATASAALARLAAGVGPQILTVDSTQSTGLKWGDVNTPHSVYTVSAVGTSDASTFSTIYVDLPNMMVQVTTSAASKVLLAFCTNVVTSNDPIARILRDDTEIRRMGAHAVDTCLTMVTLDQPGAGTHTYRVQWKSPGGQTITSTLNRHFFAVVLPG
jgi:hypothetical protein